MLGGCGLPTTRPGNDKMPAELGNLLEGLLGIRSGDLRGVPSGPRRQREIPPHNVFATADQFRIEVPVPGFNQDEIEVATENAILTITVGDVDAEEVEGELYEDESTDSSEQYIHRGFSQDPFRLSFELPTTYRPDDVNVQLVKGVLTVFVNRPEEYKRRSITINGGTGASPALEDTTGGE